MVSEINEHPIWSWSIAEEDGRSGLRCITHGKITSLIESISGIVISYYSQIQNLTLNFFKSQVLFSFTQFRTSLGSYKGKRFRYLSQD